MAVARNSRQYMGVRAVQPPDLIVADRAPTSTDIAYIMGQLWLDKTAQSSYQYVSAGDWIALGSGTTGAIVTLTGDSGGAISPVAGNIDILGTANQVTVTGTAGTLTLTLPSAITAPGSLTTTTSLAATTTVTAGTGITSTTGNIVATAGQVNAGTSMTAGTSITATLGNITATNGNFVKGTAGNKDVYTSLATTTTAGANSAGTVTLVGGTATISTTAVTASSKIRIYRQDIGATGAAALGDLTIGTITAATSFVINSVQAADATALQASDVSVVFWEIVN